MYTNHNPTSNQMSYMPRAPCEQSFGLFGILADTQKGSALKFQLLPDLQTSELAELRHSIEQFGIKIPVIVDEDGDIIDGHHRVMVADDLGIEYPTSIESGLSYSERRILAAQLNAARRQMTMAQRVQLGREIEKDIADVAKERQEALGRSQGADPLGTDDPKGRTRDEVASTVGLGSGKTYERNKILLKELAEHDPELIQHVKSGDWDMGDVREELDSRKVHVSHNSGENEWYTPLQFIDAAREVMGDIDLDPASSTIANETVQATTYYTKDDNGLTKPWYGRVWMNPPYAQPLIQHFAEKVADEYVEGNISEAIVLVNNATETKAWQYMARQAVSVCFPQGRIRYLDATGTPANTPLQGQAFLYFGDNPELFRETFSQFGVVM